ncbi:telomere-associated protein RIF1-like isoform X2 [Bombus pascuorum]|uniref:telomere-associated protein RIF1-like isoform X2 n=1 Tax=Bombus pascuorum TaxID=65598 RepID=UPI00298E7A51|nr:telomere-associated protein RIF1-like isoform X2 [Bombus pascuorum]
MASNMQSFLRMLKMLRENSNIKEKREALTYIRSNSKKLESTKSIKEEQYKELCKLVIDAFANGNNDIQNEAYETLNVVIQDFKDHTLNLFEAMWQISPKNRLKILKLLEVVEDNAISTFAYDAYAVNFFNNCMCTIQTNTMPWTASNACVDNLQALIDAESKPLSDDQRVEEETINYCITLLRRLYKVAATTSDIKVQRFHALLMDKVILLAYMGHKRQRGPALKLLQQALATNIVSHVRTKLAPAWTRYIATLQSTYCKRMLLLVSTCELDWATQWNVSIQFLGVDLHRGAGLINNLLSVEEKAFKSTDTIIRRQAFLSWKLLVDNFALDPQELATARRVKLLCIPLNAKNSKTELIALTKLEVWWHVIIRLYKDIHKFVNPVITQFLNFCFGPLGDTPLLSSKFDVVASPGKRFFKTKVVAVDALCQLLVTKQESYTAPILEERLPHPISDTVFRECYKSIIHSVGEALLVLSQLTNAEMKNRYQFGKILWTSLVSYVKIKIRSESKIAEKEIMYKDMTRVIIELTNYAGDKPMIKDLILDTILFEIADLSTDFDFQDDTLSKLVFKLLQTSILNKAEKNHYEALKCLIWQCIKSQKKNVYYLHAFNCLKELHEKIYLLLNAEDKNESVVLELWFILAHVLGEYMSDIQEINEGSITEHNFKTVESIVAFPFMYMHLEDHKQVQEVAKAWKRLYKHFEMRTDLITTVKSNEVLLNIASIMQHCLTENGESSNLILSCLDILLNTINYKLLLADTEVPSIIHLVVDLVMYFLSHKKTKECEHALKALSAVIITIYGYNAEKALLYLLICKPAIELMLQSELEMLHKEIASTWESVIIIFKGLGKLINYSLLSSYKKIIIKALNHSNLDIQLQTMSLFQLKNVLCDSPKLILEEIEKEVGKNKILSKAEITKMKNDQIEKSLNQDYVFIKTDLKFDVNRLTEHQKESLKRRKEDIAALYNDFSQSSSQDSQNLQEWFDKKSKGLGEAEKDHNKKDNISIRNILDDDANKENKIEMKELEAVSKSTAESDTKSTDNVEQNIPSESVQKAKDNAYSNENLLIEEDQMITVKTAYGNADPKTSADLDDNTQEKSLENKDDKSLFPSIIDSSKRRNRNVTLKLATPSKLEEIVYNQPGQSNTNKILRSTLKTKLIQDKSEIINKQKASENVENKLTKEEKRGIKRKSISDSESETTNARQRRKVLITETASDSNRCKSVENDNAVMSIIAIDEANLSQRTRNEISRLRINMVFDSPLSRSRRSKYCDDKKQPEENKGANIGKREAKNRSRSRKSDKIEVKKGEDTRKILQNKKSGLEEQRKVEENTKEETAETEVNSKSIPNNKCDLLNTERVIEINDTVQNIKFTEGRSHTQNDMEDVIEDSQALSKSDKSKLSKIRIELNKIEDTKTILQNKKNSLEGEKEVGEKKQEENVQTEITSKNISDDKCDLLCTKKSTENNVEVVNNNKSHSKTQILNQDLKSIEGKNQTQDDAEDIVESSQETSELLKKCTEKQCFIKINKMDDISPLVKCCDVTAEDEEVGKIVSIDCDNDNIEVPKDNVKEFEETNEISISGPKISTSIIENNLCDNEKDSVSEVQKVNDSKSLLEFSSPKSNIKRQTKLKIYSTQGRAAHMLGLVTKQARMEAEDYVIILDEEHTVKRVKSKDTDNDMLLGKKEQATMLKEVDKITATCSSRQEKIFNNMRSTDYCSSPPIKLFSNLKNDGEKVFTKADKSVDCISAQTDAQTDKIGEETMLQADELPILEWSSANPPSLTASPSASILKRQRQYIPEPDPESVTPSKRKRVSFADPPVSKEMGYETSTDSIYKVTKFTSRGLVRKDSPSRLKQIKQKLVSTDSDKLEKDEETDVTNASEVDIQCERENELLTKIAEELEYSENVTIDTDVQMCNSVENESTNVVPMPNNIKINNLNVELEITHDSTFSKHVEPTFTSKIDQSIKDEILEISKDCDVSLESNEFDHSMTQEDMFTRIDTKHNDFVEERTSNVDTSAIQNTSIMNNSLDLLKFNVQDNSIIKHSSEKHANSEYLDDTIDAANFTVLNSSANSDEIFCGKLIRTSTQATENTQENMQEQDTLPVTDSVFGSLPSSQDSQNTSEFNVETPHPELLDSIQPIYPTLILCKESITSIIDHLTNPLWVQHLFKYFKHRNVQTIGDLAQLSEREINRIPVKSNSKVEFVKNVLKCFEKKNAEKVSNNNEVSCSVNINVPASTRKVTTEDQAMKNSTDEIHNELIYHIPLSQSSSSTVFNNVIIDKNARKMFKETTESASNELSNMLTVDTCKANFQAMCEVAQTTRSESSNVTTRQITNTPASSKVTISTSESGTENSSSCAGNAVTTTQATKTVATCTSIDSIYLSKAAANKATKSVAAQMALEDLLDEIDVNLVLESAVRRCTPEKLLLQYKNKMRHVSQVELESETIRMLGTENRKNSNEVILKMACRACGVNKVLLRLPDIFSADKQFFVKVLNTYRKKIKTSDCLDILNFNEVKDAVYEKCISSELAEMLSKKLKEEEQQGIRKPMTELSSLNAMLKRMPMDVIISHTVANDELIPPRVVLDIALQNNSPTDIAQALESQSSPVLENIFSNLWSSQFAVECIEQFCESKEDLLKIFEAVSSKFSQEDLLQAFYESMKTKLMVKQEND